MVSDIKNMYEELNIANNIIDNIITTNSKQEPNLSNNINKKHKTNIPFYYYLKDVYYNPYSSSFDPNYNLNNIQVDNSNKSTNNSINEDINNITISSIRSNSIIGNNNLIQNINEEEPLEFPDSTENLYESLFRKYMLMFKSKPSLSVRVPYVIELLGDTITNLFKEKVISTSSDDVIVTGNIISDLNKESRIEFFDFPSITLTLDINKIYDYVKYKANKNCLEEKFEDKRYVKYLVEKYHKFKNDNAFIKDTLKDKYYTVDQIYFVVKALIDALNNSNLLCSEKPVNFNILIYLGKSYKLNQSVSLFNCYLSCYFYFLYLYFENLENNLTLENLMFMANINIENLLYDVDSPYFTYFKTNFNNNNRIFKDTILSSYLLAIFTLNKNEIGIIDSSNKLTKHSINKKIRLLLIESFTSEPPMYYKNINNWNKRHLEIRFGIAILVYNILSNNSLDNTYKTLKDSILNICILESKNLDFVDITLKLSKNFTMFYNIVVENYKNNIDILLSNFINSNNYYTEDIKNALPSKIINELIKDIEFSENIMISNSSLSNKKSISNSLNSKFNLLNRLTFLFSELNRINKLKDKISNSVESINLSKNIIEEILIETNISNNELIKYYSCYSDEQINILKNISNLNINDIACRINSFGWKGQLLVIGDEDKINTVKNIMLKRLDHIESSSSIAKLWITDDFDKYCFSTYIGGIFSYINLSFENFTYMINEINN